MKILLFFLCLVSLATATRGQQYRLLWEPGQIPELYSPVHFQVQAREGTAWKPLEIKGVSIETNWGWVQDGAFYFQEEDRAKNKGVVHFKLYRKGEPLNLIDSLPYLQKIRFHPYTDSIKPVLGFYLPVEGLFSSQRTYPLDTQFLCLRAASGKLEGMSWEREAGDTAQKVRFDAWYQYDPQISAQIILYIRRQWQD